MKRHVPYIGLLYLVAILFSVWGFAAARYEIFPYHELRVAADQTQAFLQGGEGEDKTLAQRLTLHRQEKLRDESLAYSDRTGFVRVDSQFTDPGYLLVSRFSSEAGQVVTELVRLSDFKRLHRWTPPIGKILEQSSEDNDTRSRAGFRVLHPLLLEDGALVFGAGEGPLARIDRESRLEWVIDRHFHHSIEQDHEGNLLAPIVVEDSQQAFPVPIRNDGYAVVSPEGELLGEKSIAQILLRNGHNALLFGIGEVERDIIHLNDAQPVLREHSGSQRGDIALSVRNLSTVFLYRPSTDEVIWLKTGPWLNQHDVNITGEGLYSVFGNDVVRYRDRFVPAAEISDVYLYDPVEDTTYQPYSDLLESINAFTNTGGKSRVLRNRDLYVEVHEAGQLFRLGDGGVRWVFVNGQSDDTVGMVYWARYLYPDQVDLDWLATPILAQTNRTVDGNTPDPSSGARE